MENGLLKFMIFLMLCLNLNAKDFVSIYRLEGISSVEKEIESVLKDVDYWKTYLQDKNVDYGYYEFKKYILIAQKKQSEISLFQKEGNDYKLLAKNSVIVGENEGDKYTQGDKKTPEGAYDLLQKKNDVDRFYGPFALVTSYPNIFDKSLNKDGSGIWIHGMPYDTDREKFTKGCIALDNSELENLEKKLQIDKTVLLIANNDLKKTTKEEIALIMSSIFKWKESWKNSDLNSYLSYYSNEFKRADKSGFGLFSEQKKSVFAKNEQKTIKLTNIDISPYPNSYGKNMFKATMDEEYLSPAIKFYGKKELFLEIASGQVKILSED